MSFAVLLSAASVQADTLAFWGMQNTANLVTPTTVGAGLTATPMVGVNLNTWVNMSPHGSSTNNYIGWARSSTTGGVNDLSLDQTLANATYFSISLTPLAGQVLNVNNISFDCMVGTANAAANREFFLLSNETGYDDTHVLLAGGTQTTIAGYTFPGPVIPLNNSTTGDTLFSVDLSGNSAFQNVTSPMSFRFYINTDTVSQNVGFSQLTVNGSVVPAPEPSSVAFLALGSCSALIFHRHRCRK
jgi:hypothetical protein